MTARRVVLVLPDPPLPFGNAAARWFWVLVKGLHERGHEVVTEILEKELDALSLIPR